MHREPRIRILWLISGAAALGLAGSVAAQPAPAGVTTVSPLTAVGVPVPNVGQPVKMYTLAEIHQIGSDALAERNELEDQRAELDSCYQRAYAVQPNVSRMIGYEEGAEAARKVSMASAEAERATAAAAQARVDAGAGKATMAQVEETELDRQAAVQTLLNAQAELNEARYKAIDIQQMVRDHRPIQEWDAIVRTNAAERTSRKNPLVPKALESLALENIHLYQRQDAKTGTFLTVTGVIHNTGAGRADIPALTLTAVDQNRAPLKAETVALTGKIEPGASLAFTYDFKPSPAGTASVAVAFAAMRNTGHLDSVAADPVCQGSAPPELNPRIVGNGFVQPSGRTFQSTLPETTEDAAGHIIVTTTGGQRSPDARTGTPRN